MKIKRLTAGLAVAAMAATFFAAAPVLSAQAAPGDQPATPIGFLATRAVSDPITPILDAGVVYGGQPNKISIASLINAGDPGESIAAFSTGWSTFGVQYGSPVVIPTWPCITANSRLIDPQTGAQLLPTDKRYGTISCDAFGNLIYTPSLAMGANGPVVIKIYYEIVGWVATSWAADPAANATLSPWVSGTISVTVQNKPASSGCAYDDQAQCLTADLQAFAKKDGPASAKINVITPNVLFTDKNGNTTGFVTGDENWGLVLVDKASSIDQSISSTTLMGWASYTQGKKGDSITFTLPKTQYNWSGTVSYLFELAPFICDANGNVTSDGNYACMNQAQTGLATFIVHPTLTAPDDITSDQGAKVTVPLLGANALPIIGTAPFQDASCTFADTKSKTTLSGVGSISNPGGSKNPVFTPVADFVGDVTLTCTVADKWDPISNPVDVVIHVGTPAPAPVAPATTPAPACDNANGKCVLSVTGGSLAAPMSSGLAAVVLLVAAGAGILVVRRRTALAS